MVGTKGEGDILDKRAVIVLKGELHRYTTADDTAVELIEVEFGLAEYGGSTIADEAVEHVVAFFGKEILDTTIGLAPDGFYYLVDGLDIEVR